MLEALALEGYDLPIVPLAEWRLRLLAAAANGGAATDAASLLAAAADGAETRLDGGLLGTVDSPGFLPPDR